MKIKILDKFSYQAYPITEDMIEIEESVLQEIGKTKQFDVFNKSVIPYNNSAELQAEKNEQRKAEIKSRLTELSEDIIQDATGEYVPNINERKAEFIRLHNELRELEGKAPRILK